MKIKMGVRIEAFPFARLSHCQADILLTAANRSPSPPLWQGDPVGRRSCRFFAIIMETTMQKLPFILAAAVACAAATSANAGDPPRSCTSAPESRWLRIADIQAKVEEQGYKVRKAKFKKGCGEVYAIDKNGQRMELFVDPTDAKIVDSKKAGD
jgi:hypothetical protein